MTKNNFIVLRSGINSTFQDLGRNNLYHIGLPFSGAMDRRNYIISNHLVGNKDNEAVIEFAYQGPLLRVENGKVNFAITGDVNFQIKKKAKEIINGECYKTYQLNENDEIDIISTNKSVYGYLAVSGGFDVKKNFGSFSTIVRAGIGANNGNKILEKDKITIDSTAIDLGSNPTEKAVLGNVTQTELNNCTRQRRSLNGFTRLARHTVTTLME